MKKTILLSILMAGVSFAGFEKWTNKDGKTAELDLVKVTETGGEKAGEFKMRNGKSVTLKLSDLADADQKRLEEWKPAAAPAGEAKPSVFDKDLDGNLVKLEGKSLKKYELTAKPTKYYLFYYTASWCGPCQKFTPSLVEFYEKNKPGNDTFEIVLVTSDADEDAMEGYAVEKKMSWPHLKLSKTEKFKKSVAHPGGGIPNLVLTDLEGKILKSSYEGKEYKGPHVVMNHLETLLKE
ncbi:thioredoxin-like domain-containing protein [Luteolibacter flavescens]|uniref:Thioredoxin-like domain-containing protein n=1 Tax=Luteolibacter flavescens TaxID=1859460 RepID=A0ABT3FJJ7_9BACT|nr:thioredoxin-like domain-containing protein [Luteolibacter flavescens]MCW1883165.1 thioredoxin-like domain-containing protein [Luteolibacter flavescens]